MPDLDATEQYWRRRIADELRAQLWRFGGREEFVVRKLAQQIERPADPPVALPPAPPIAQGEVTRCELCGLDRVLITTPMIAHVPCSGFDF